MKQIGFLLTIFVLFFACNNTPTIDETNNEPEEYKMPAAAQTLYDIVGAKHDTAMLLEKDIARLQNLLRKHMKANAKLKAVEEQCLELLPPLRKAHEEMDKWMVEFKNPDLHTEFYQSKSEAELMQYLKAEETAIELVHQQMIESTQKAQAYLDSNKEE